MIYNMVSFFCYHKMMDKKNIVNIHDKYVMKTGYVMVNRHDQDTQHICLCKIKSQRLYGIIVDFKEITINEIITKINCAEELRLHTINTYTLDTIQAYCEDDSEVSCYIIYNEPCTKGVPTMPLRL